MITSSGNLYVIHAGVHIVRQGDSITLTKDDATLTTTDPRFVEGVLTAAVRQGIRVDTEEAPLVSPEAHEGNDLPDSGGSAVVLLPDGTVGVDRQVQGSVIDDRALPRGRR